MFEVEGEFARVVVLIRSRSDFFFAAIGSTSLLLTMGDWKAKLSSYRRVAQEGY
jgi:hypothetical protein